MQRRHNDILLVPLWNYLSVRELCACVRSLCGVCERGVPCLRSTLVGTKFWRIRGCAEVNKRCPLCPSVCHHNHLSTLPTKDFLIIYERTYTQCGYWMTTTTATSVRVSSTSGAACKPFALGSFAHFLASAPRRRPFGRKFRFGGGCSVVVWFL